MKKLLLFISALALNCFHLNAQAPALQWAQGIGSLGSDFAVGVTVDTNGNIYSVGTFSGTVDFDPSATTFTASANGNNDIYILKTDAAGSFLWAKTIGGIGYEKVVSISMNTNNELIIVGTFGNAVDFDPSTSVSSLTSTGLDDIFIGKYDLNGNYINAVHVGGTAIETPYDFKVTSSTNDIIIVGAFQGTSNFNISPLTTMVVSAGYDDIFMASYSNSLTLNWVKNMGTTTNEYATSVDLDAGNNIFMSGRFNGTLDFDPSVATNTVISNAYSVDIFLAKYDINGNYIFAFNVGSSSTDGNSKVIIDALNNVYLGGSVSPNGSVDYNPGPTKDTIIAPSFYSYGFIAKYTNSGSFAWVKPISSNYSMGVTVDALSVDTNNNIIVGGGYSGQLQPEGAFTTYFPSNGYEDVYLISFSSLGIYNYSGLFGGINSDGIKDITSSGNSLIICGAFQDGVDFDFSTATSSLNSAGALDSYVAKYTLSLTTGIYSQDTEKGVSIYPNPTSELLFIDATTLVNNSTVELSDVTGRIILNKTITLNKEQIDISNLNKGIYFLCIKNSGQSIIRKIIKE